MRTAFVLSVLHTAFLAEAALVALLYACPFSTSSALFAKPIVVLTTIYAMIAAARALLVLIPQAKALVTFRAMLLFFVARLAQAAVGADVVIARVTLTAMLRAFKYTKTTDGMFQTSRTFGPGSFFSCNYQTITTQFALQFATTLAMRYYCTGIAGTLIVIISIVKVADWAMVMLLVKIRTTCITNLFTNIPVTQFTIVSLAYAVPA